MTSFEPHWRVIAKKPQFLPLAFSQTRVERSRSQHLLEPHTNLRQTPQRLQHRMDATAQWRPTSSGLRTSPEAKDPLPPERLPTAQASESRTKEPASPTTIPIAAT